MQEPQVVAKIKKVDYLFLKPIFLVHQFTLTLKK